MATIFATARRLSIGLMFAACAAFAITSHASNVQFVGGASYTCAGGVGILTASRVENYSNYYSGTLRLELWAFSTPYNGSQTLGYKLAQHTLGQLLANQYFYNISSGTVVCVPPPDGTWYPVMILTEYTGSGVNGGYDSRDWVNMTPPIVIGAPGQLTFSSTSLNFGNQVVGTTSATQTITVTNTGGATVNFYSTYLSNTTDFAVFTNCPTALAPGASCFGSVTFSPKTSGTRSAIVTVNSDGLGSPQYISLSGNGTVATPPGQLSMQSAISFASQTVGTTSAAQTVTVSNIGGQTVNISSRTISSADFAASSVGCTSVAPGSYCTITVTFSPVSTGTKFGTITIVSDGIGSPQTIQLSGLAVAGAPPPVNTAIAIEYYHAAFNHYFVTAIADEITKLDNGVFVGWTRTGQSFKVYTTSQATLAPVCRFFSTAFAPKSSHFYTPDAPECAVVQSNPNWQFEAVVFFVAKADVAGNCPAGTQAVYRLYNNGQGGAPNHRYTINLTLRSQMLGQGWIPEGYGSIGVIMCSPL